MPRRFLVFIAIIQSILFPCGLLEMKRAGSRTIAQDEASSVVYGMPAEAVALGAADEILPLSKIARAILNGA